MNTLRIAKIKACLEKALQPSFLNITDQSEAHLGHAGAKDGRGHFTVEIQSPLLRGKSTLAAHRLIYQALKDLLETDIHALCIRLKDC